MFFLIANHVYQWVTCRRTVNSRLLRNSAEGLWVRAMLSRATPKPRVLMSWWSLHHWHWISKWCGFIPSPGQKRMRY